MKQRQIRPAVRGLQGHEKPMCMLVIGIKRHGPLGGGKPLAAIVAVVDRRRSDARHCSDRQPAKTAAFQIEPILERGGIDRKAVRDQGSAIQRHRLQGTGKVGAGARALECDCVNLQIRGEHQPIAIRLDQIARPSLAQARKQLAKAGACRIAFDPWPEHVRELFAPGMPVRLEREIGDQGHGLACAQHGNGAGRVQHYLPQQA